MVVRMVSLRAAPLAASLALLGCARSIGSSDDEIGDTSDSTSSTDSATDSSSTSSTSAGTSDTSETDTLDSADTSDSTSSSESSTDTTETTDTGGCEPDLIECPDGACVYPFPEYSCCSHGGACAAGCEPQDADKGMGLCPGAPEYAWTGEACEEVCPCQGSDCAAVFDSPITCLEAYQNGCGGIDFSQCPFDAPVSAISIIGQIPGESVDLQFGAFGLFYGKGNGVQLLLRFAADELTLANYIAHAWPDQYSEGVLQLWAEPVIGVQEVTLVWGPGFEPMALGTLTILDLDLISPDSLDYFVTGTLEVTADGWDLAGSFGLRHCYPLNQYAP